MPKTDALPLRYWCEFKQNGASSKKKCKLSNQNNLDTHFSMEEIREDV
jgi:hypothetical protein